MEELKYIQQGRHSPIEDTEIAVSNNVQDTLLARETQDIEPLLHGDSVNNKDKLKKYSEINNVPWFAFFQHSVRFQLITYYYSLTH